MEYRRRRDSPFNSVRGLKYGYNKMQVEDFFELARKEFNRDLEESTDFNAHKIRIVFFEKIRGGYDFSQVDAALERLEDAFLQREREQFVVLEGEQRWRSYMEELLEFSCSRLSRPIGQRFYRAQINDLAYNIRDVDKFCDSINYALNNEGANLQVQDIRNAIFRTVKGEKGYAEKQVDFFLDTMIKIFSAIK